MQYGCAFLLHFGFVYSNIIILLISYIERPKQTGLSINTFAFFVPITKRFFKYRFAT